MEVRYASVASPRSRNEDLIVAGGSWVVVLDGATVAPGIETGCVHDVPWLVATLGVNLVKTLATHPAADLQQALADAIVALRDAHGHTCDLANPDSPSSTVAILREGDGGLVEYLVLADSPIILETRSDGIMAIVDDRPGKLPSYEREAIRGRRNQPGGFWVASTNPAAAEQALTGAIERASLRRAAVLTDGAARLVDRYGWTWLDLLDALERHGPCHLLARTREAEATTEPGRYRGKYHDDATAALCRFADPSG